MRKRPAGCCNRSCLVRTNVAKADASFYEVYAKATYTMGDWAFGPTFFYSPNFLNTGADGEYLSGIVNYTAPSTMALFNGAVGWYVSGEFGHQWLGTSDAFYGVSDRLPAPPSPTASRSLTTTPGTSASASPGRCSRSICATATPI